ncbi:MAG: septation protein A [Limnobacter sp.]|nr:septation protein A [Limnobacter sp.]
MKMFLDFLPIVLFFITFKWAGSDPQAAQEAIGPFLSSISNATLDEKQIPILAATIVAILATLAQVTYQKLTGKPVEKMQWIGLGLIVIFGGATLVLQDETFIKWKPTVLYWAMAAGFLIAGLFKKNPIELMMKGQIELPTPVWTSLLYAWVLFFLVMGVANIAVAYSFSTDFWVDFKLFGTLGATLLFVLAQGLYMSKHMKQETTQEGQ